MTDKIDVPEGIEQPNLDEPETIRELLRAHAIAVSNRLAEAAHKNVALNEVIEADKKASAFLASTLMGKNPSYKKPKINTQEAIERHLRSSVDKELKQYNLGAADIKEATELFQASAFAFTNQIHELINELKKQPDSIEQKGITRLNALLDHWVQILTGSIN